jgi:hypothetical protein
MGETAQITNPVGTSMQERSGRPQNGPVMLHPTNAIGELERRASQVRRCTNVVGNGKDLRAR